VISRISAFFRFFVPARIFEVDDEVGRMLVQLVDEGAVDALAVEAALLRRDRAEERPGVERPRGC
jgi:hypothetical protein